MNILRPSTWFAAAKPAKTTDPAKVDTSVVSIERAQFSSNGGFPRVNLDDLAAKKTLKIYARMRLDAQVKAVVTFKRDAILSRGWTFEYDKDSKLSDAEKDKRVRVVEQIVRQLPGSFIDALNVVSTGREFGFSVTEKVYAPVEVDGAQYVGLGGLLGRDPTTFNFYTDDYGTLVKCEQLAGGNVVPIDLAKFVHYVHNPEFDRYFGRSDLREAYRAWYSKDLVIDFWDMFLEKMGGGFVIGSIGADANISANSPAYVALVAAFENMKASASVLLPRGVTAEVVFPTTTGGFQEALEYRDLEIAKALLVPNLAGVSHTGKTGAYSQAQTQLEAFAWTLKADAERLESCVDEQLFRDLGDQNWGDGEYPCFKFKPLSGEQLRWVVDTWAQLVLAKAVIPSEVDEARLREILEMPPREPDSKPLVDPATQSQIDAQSQMADKTFQLGERGKDNQLQRDRKRALDPVLSKADAAKAQYKKQFGYDPSESRDDHGRWTDGGGSSTVVGDRAAKIEKKVQSGIAAGEKALAAHEANPPKGGRPGVRRAQIQKALDAYREAAQHLDALQRAHKSGPGADLHDRLRQAEGAYVNASELASKADFATDARTARISIASARERVDFAVIDQRQTAASDQLSSDLALSVARATKKLLGTDEDVARLTDQDTADIANAQLDPMAVGRIKATTQKALLESWTMGSRMARDEVRRTSGKAMARDAQHFADIRQNAAAYFESTAFKVAGDVSDRARSIIQQELLTSVKIGRSPAQTRTAIWERLVARGLTSQEAVRSTDNDAAVNSALDELWKDTPEAAAAYLDTVARTNLFGAMNEARYAEFTDPALGDFVAALRYSAVLDDHTTEICQALNGDVWVTDSEMWDEYRPPNHFNCRSVLIPITQLDVQDGLWDGVESDAPDVEPQPGFGS